MKWATDLPGSGLPGKRKYLWILGSAALCILLPAGFYWLLTGGNIVRCIFGDAACSLTVSTYLLDGLTGLVFAATVLGALYAKAAFEHERHAGLSVHQCATKACGMTDKDIYFDDDSEEFTEIEPNLYDETWGNANIDCINVGKSPLIGCEVQVALGEATEDRHGFRPRVVKIASMRAGGEVHVRLWLSRKHEKEKVFVRAARHQLVEDFRFYRVDNALDIGAFTFPKPAPMATEPELKPAEMAPPPRPPDLTRESRDVELRPEKTPADAEKSTVDPQKANAEVPAEVRSLEAETESSPSDPAIRSSRVDVSGEPEAAKADTSTPTTELVLPSNNAPADDDARRDTNIDESDPQRDQSQPASAVTAKSPPPIAENDVPGSDDGAIKGES